MQFAATATVGLKFSFFAFALHFSAKGSAMQWAPTSMAASCTSGTASGRRLDASVVNQCKPPQCARQALWGADIPIAMRFCVVELLDTLFLLPCTFQLTRGLQGNSLRLGTLIGLQKVALDVRTAA